jgi:archaellum biogenesis ATPase FlaH
MIDAETLRSFISQMRAIAADCVDLGASDRLRVLSEELEKITKRPAVLSSSGPRRTPSRQRQQMS